MHNWNGRAKNVKLELDNVNLIQESNFNLELMKIKQDEVTIKAMRKYGDKLFPAHYANQNKVTPHGMKKGYGTFSGNKDKVLAAKRMLTVQKSKSMIYGHAEQDDSEIEEDPLIDTKNKFIKQY